MLNVKLNAIKRNGSPRKSVYQNFPNLTLKRLGFLKVDFSGGFNLRSGIWGLLAHLGPDKLNF